MHREGFKVAIDSVTPDMVNYLNLAAFDVDFIKINVSKDRAGLLADPAIREGLARIPKEKLIFFRCDNERALKAGLEMGVGKFQGWMIDDAVQQGKGATWNWRCGALPVLTDIKGYENLGLPFLASS